MGWICIMNSILVPLSLALFRNDFSPVTLTYEWFQKFLTFVYPDQFFRAENNQTQLNRRCQLDCKICEKLKRIYPVKQDKCHITVIYVHLLLWKSNHTRIVFIASVHMNIIFSTTSLQVILSVCANSQLYQQSIQSWYF